MNILIATAHPDDLENGMGGTLAKLAHAGHKISVVIATCEDGSERHREARAALDLIKVNDLEAWGEPDGKLEVTAALAARMREVYARVQPDAVFTLWPADVHPDHRNIASLAMGPALQKGVNTELFCFEVCSSGRAAQTIRPQSLGFHPTHYHQLSRRIVTTKRKMMACHKTQDPKGMWLGVRSMLKMRSRELESAYAHCFAGFPDDGLDVSDAPERDGMAEAFVRLTRIGEPHSQLVKVLRLSPFSLPRGIGPEFSPEAIGITPK